ncbi:MAG: helix-turn-helix transcriptional regulator [Bdellovibrionaceae bacterium]|nr:helix-turn-helix transcriptional regulator [Pseudobdellovibrionaceae bacterium]MBX3035119.1 helix-turn-helix transcriptional regulator [Pseudobdellovibrionaceae bacterium]
MNMGKNLKRLLAERGMSVVLLSKRAQVPAKTIYHWMGGQRPRNVEQIYRICQILGVSIEELFGLAPLTQSQGNLAGKNLLGVDYHAGVFEVILRPIRPANGGQS